MTRCLHHRRFEIAPFNIACRFDSGRGSATPFLFRFFSGTSMSGQNLVYEYAHAMRRFSGSVSA